MMFLEAVLAITAVNVALLGKRGVDSGHPMYFRPPIKWLVMSASCAIRRERAGISFSAFARTMALVVYGLCNRGCGHAVRTEDRAQDEPYHDRHGNFPC
jgi:hypothetical protein